jgi:hypothetical protein
LPKRSLGGCCNVDEAHARTMPDALSALAVFEKFEIQATQFNVNFQFHLQSGGARKTMIYRQVAE